MAFQYVLLFMVISIPILTSSLHFAGTLILDSQAKERMLQHQYAQSVCNPWQSWEDVDRDHLDPQSVEVNGYIVSWDKDTCTVEKAPTP